MENVFIYVLYFEGFPTPKHKVIQCEFKPGEYQSTVSKPSPSLNLVSKLPFLGENKVPDFIECKPDIEKPESLKLFEVKITENLQFMDRILPSTDCKLVEHPVFNRAYFLDLQS